MVMQYVGAFFVDIYDTGFNPTQHTAEVAIFNLTPDVQRRSYARISSAIHSRFIDNAAHPVVLHKSSQGSVCFWALHVLPVMSDASRRLASRDSHLLQAFNGYD